MLSKRKLEVKLNELYSYKPGVSQGPKSGVFLMSNVDTEWNVISEPPPLTGGMSGGVECYDKSRDKQKDKKKMLVALLV